MITSGAFISTCARVHMRRDTPAGKALFKLYGRDKTSTCIGNMYDDQNRKKMEAKVAAGWTPPPKGKAIQPANKSRKPGIHGTCTIVPSVLASSKPLRRPYCMARPLPSGRDSVCGKWCLCKLVHVYKGTQGLHSFI